MQKLGNQKFSAIFKKLNVNFLAGSHTIFLNKRVFKHIFAFLLMQMRACYKEQMREVIDYDSRSLHGLPGQRC